PWKRAAFARRSICRPARAFYRNTARNFSLGWEKRKALYAPAFAGPMVKHRSLRICPQTTASKSRKAFKNSQPSRLRPRLPLTAETWLIQPLLAPDFSLPDLAGDTKQLHSFRGNFVLLHFWATAAPACA